ncbi:MAG: GNAT family N-acetyltransferase [Gammaproteobacteria bacterium]|nr:GNAT family N-acetyltransferase [Gammaproteobacteria bacterium]
MDQQFHWHNHGYRSFDDFLAELASKKRKNLRRERREALADGIEIELGHRQRPARTPLGRLPRVLPGHRGAQVGQSLLTREFFSRIGEAMPDRTLLILCRRGGRYIAGALNFIGDEALYGRNWGCIEDHRFLHFEACYYQAVDFAIERGLARVEAGAQGGHKVARGYVPSATHSAHWIAHPGLRAAVAEYLERERTWVREDMEAVATMTPYRQSGRPETVDPDLIRRGG